MMDKELIHRRNSLLFILVSVFYLTQVIINIFIEGLASIFPPAFLFMVFGITLLLLIYKKVNPEITMYGLVSCMYIYFYFLLKDSPYLVNYLFMWLALPLSAIYQSYRMVVIAGVASILLTFYAFFHLHQEIFPNVESGDFIYLVLFGVFISTFLITLIRKLREANAKLQELAFYDPLTGAANRILLKEKFDMLKNKQVDSIALLFIDMNDFKRINDTYGHSIGDQLLKRTVTRINSVLRNTDLLCRIGGDEFVVLSYNNEDTILEKIAKRIHLSLEEPMMLDLHMISVTASIGWYNTTDISDLHLDRIINEADRAMYEVKGNKAISLNH